MIKSVTLGTSLSSPLIPSIALPLLLLLSHCSASPVQIDGGEKQLGDLIHEMKLLRNRVEQLLTERIHNNNNNNADIEDAATAEKRALFWSGDKRAAPLPFSGGIYGKRAPLPLSGGIYGKRSGAIPFIIPAVFEREVRAVPFNGGMYG